MNLSSKHQQKLSTIESGHKRLVKYYKFYKKDSIRYLRKLDKHYKNIIDSACRSEIKQDRLRRRLAKKGIVLPLEKVSVTDSLDQQLKHWWAITEDSTVSDSIKQIARSKVKDIALEKARHYPGFQILSDNYHLKGEVPNWKKISQQVPGIDSLQSAFNSSPNQLFESAEDKLENKLSNISGAKGGLREIEKLKQLPGQYTQDYKKFTDKKSLTNQGKEEAVKKAVDYFADHGKELQAVQQKASRLLSKYKDYTNSNDLSKAVKQTSMKGKTFWEHLVISGNFNIVSTSPFSIDLSPLIGYKFTTRFFLGLGMNYRYTYSDSIKHSWYVSPKNAGIKAFVNYDIIKNFYAYGEWDKSNVLIKSNDKTKRTWSDNYYVGIGKRIAIHPKLYMTITGLYNLNSTNKNPINPHRFQVRTGFQLSELATRKKKVYYDPNR